MVEKKKFHQIDLNFMGQKADVYISNIESLNGKIVRLDLTRQLKGKSIEVQIKLKVSDGKLNTEFKRLNLLKYFILRMMRKRMSYVEDSFVMECNDGKIRIKPILITRRKVHRSVRKNLRNTCREWLIKDLKEKNIDEIALEIVHGKIQRVLMGVLKKVYPLSLCEIRDMIVLERTAPKKTIKKENEKIVEKVGEGKIEGKELRESLEEAKKKLLSKKESIEKNKEKIQTTEEVKKEKTKKNKKKEE